MSSRPQDLHSKSDTRTRDENLALSERAGREIEELLRQGKATERVLKCPNCKFALATAFSTTPAYLKIKCKKCGMVLPINLATFCSKKTDTDSMFKI